LTRTLPGKAPSRSANNRAQRLRCLQSLKLLGRQSPFDLFSAPFELADLLSLTINFAVDLGGSFVRLSAATDEKGQRQQRRERDDARDCPRQRAIAKRLTGEIEVGAH
jgi:hypothetical protein